MFGSVNETLISPASHEFIGYKLYQLPFVENMLYKYQVWIGPCQNTAP